MFAYWAIFRETGAVGGRRMSLQLKAFILKMFTVSSNGLSREQWIAVSVVGLLFGIFLMKGFGSRNDY